MIHLLVDARPLSASSSTRGIGTYLRSVLSHLAAEPDFEVAALAIDGGELPDAIRRVPIRRSFDNRLNFYEQSLRLPGDITRVAPDLFHSPGSDPPRRCDVPWVQTLHDVTPVAFGHPKFRGERRRWRARARRIRQASAVIADSKFTAADGLRLLGLDPARLHVVPLGVDPEFRPPPSRPEPDQPYVLYVSEYGPHKGFAEAFGVIAALADAGLPHRLKMVGKMGPRAEMRVRSLLDPSGRPERVDLLNWVTPAQLCELYQGASLLLMTSRYEGFGLPVLEAMACGTPVVSFDNSALPEVVGPGGVLVADGDVPAFAAAAAALLRDHARWHEVSEAGLQWARRFRWEQSAAAHADVFRGLV